MSKAFLSWLGGKARLSEKIIPLIPPHICYCEVFAGAAWMLFKKSESKSEVLNDINVDLVTLYRVVQNHLDEFVRYFRWALVSRDEFERLKRVEANTLTDIQRSARFFYLNGCSFNGIVAATSFKTSTFGKPQFNLLRIEETLSAAHLRLARVRIENAPYMEVINRYDRPHTFFYLDPPYFQRENLYGRGIFRRDDFALIAERLAEIDGKFILSINNTPEVRQIFRGFHIRKVHHVYSSAPGKHRPVVELLIMNFQPAGARRLGA